MRALLIRRDPDHRVEITDVPETDLPEGDVLIDVSHSSLNYKDGLAVTNTGKIVRGEFPFVPGIDLAGTVAESASGDWSPGDRVILTGWGTGENRWGGYAERARASAEHLVAMPKNLSPEIAMWMGTAGFTAALSVLAIRDGEVSPEDGPIVVTGASGGVGSVAVALLAADGFEVHAVTGTESAHNYLRSLGAAEILGREALATPPDNPMGAATWAGAVDSVGGTTLETILATAKRHACIAACGLAGGHVLSTTVFPFILRGVALQGIDSNTATLDTRRVAWNLLANAVASGALDDVEKTVIRLDDVPAWAEKIVAGETLGRVVVEL
ncbi:MDR family oxidoreductase [Rubricoccus marinus]|uniref:Oxidoreductase n=1 Tax=Rubricoccus marinus TaxID=716817 RepID=A0A259TZ65_9BACT|nr:MDR family oxidoreductase [Rubricoccus marinus]OZC02976.1 oxidoreductase [Rubricoccus marinus]